jgi:glycosyltransferase involved in cell wall biosynthesis
MKLTRTTSAPRRSTASSPAAIFSVGVSTSPVCGVRDYARVVGRAIEERGVVAPERWLEVGCDRPLESWRATRRWLEALGSDLRELAPDSIVWHYSVFSYGYRGLPTLVPLFARTLRASGVPVVTVAHEFVYPFGTRGARGALLASAQRVALPAVVRASSAIVVTTDKRRAWFESRRWLPRREIHVLPVPSNLPQAGTSGRSPSGTSPSELVLGVFSFAAESIRPAPVASALRLLRGEGLDARLVLIGAPGESSPQGAAWRHAARTEKVEDAISFTGVLEPDLLAQALGAVDVVLFVDADGPSSRRSSLAATLAAGKPVVAYDGPATWSAAVAAGALAVVPATGEDLARELRAFAEPGVRAERGRRGADFYAAHQAPDVIAGSFLEIVDRVARREGRR